ncbi:MAG TPA: SAM-dependent chlorinase/fluorinase [Dehalococcoidia bacterium]|nr:SAM-dependent chlorinase/fluorinase [Dehalococcoidia bacterium]
MSAPLVTLTTDFGLQDSYAGQMKGALLAVSPEARIVDLTHEIAPQGISEAAFVLETAWRFFPPGTIHVVVVDPGVGSGRRRLIIEAEGHFFVGPDNGCLSAALPDTARGLRPPEAGYEARPLRLPRSVRAFAFAREDLLPRRPSATFEGRDVFAPVAGLLAGGTKAAELGRRVTELLALPAFRGPPVPEGLDGMVMRCDRFGNLITDIRGGDLRPGARVLVAAEELEVARTYSEAPGLTALVGSSGYLEVALPNGNAAAALAAGPGTPVLVKQ